MFSLKSVGEFKCRMTLGRRIYYSRRLNKLIHSFTQVINPSSQAYTQFIKVLRQLNQVIHTGWG